MEGLRPGIRPLRRRASPGERVFAASAEASNLTSGLVTSTRGTRSVVRRSYPLASAARHDALRPVVSQKLPDQTLPLEVASK